MPDRLCYSGILKKYERSSGTGIREDIRKILSSNPVKIVILDDDPTGIQTVHGCLLLTHWEKENLRTAFNDKSPFFYILTNSRSMNAEDAERINRDVIEAVLKVHEKFNHKLIFISRSDSTLRGHFPLEPETISATLADCNRPPSLPVFFIPCLIEAGRFTVDNTHYLKNGDELIPVSETEFSLDNVFPFKNADLEEYIIEKSGRRINREEIGSLSLEILRSRSRGELVKILAALKQKRFVIINALEYDDLYKFSYSLLKLFLNSENPLVIRSSSSLPKAITGIPDKAFLSKNALIKPDKPGIFIVGSHVQKATEQLHTILKYNKVTGIEVDIQQVISDPGNLIIHIIDRITQIWSTGNTPVIFTSREEIRLKNKTDRLQLGNKISGFLVSIVTKLPEQPGYIVAKGGITSHDILTKGLNIDSARVSGQIIPGVPVIITGKAHKFPEMPYIIFPGNVGDENALKTVLKKLT